MLEFIRGKEKMSLMGIIVLSVICLFIVYAIPFFRGLRPLVWAAVIVSIGALMFVIGQEVKKSRRLSAVFNNIYTDAGATILQALGIAAITGIMVLPKINDISIIKGMRMPGIILGLSAILLVAAQRVLSNPVHEKELSKLPGWAKTFFVIWLFVLTVGFLWAFFKFI